MAGSGSSRIPRCRTMAGMIAGLKTGLHRFNPETSNFTLLHVVEPHAPNNRLNDGFVDSEGFLWFGSMDDNEEEPSGALYQLNDEVAFAAIQAIS